MSDKSYVTLESDGPQALVKHINCGTTFSVDACGEDNLEYDGKELIPVCPKCTAKFDFLPPEHRPGGSRALHDDFYFKIKDHTMQVHKIYFWPFNLIPRTWTSWPCLRPPRLIAGNQKYWCSIDNASITESRYYRDGWYRVKFKNYLGEDEYNSIHQDTLENAIRQKIIGPMPIPRQGEWQFSLTPTGAWKIPLPYFAITTETGREFRVGFRWTNPVLGDKEKYSYVAISIAVHLGRKT